MAVIYGIQPDPSRPPSIITYNSPSLPCYFPKWSLRNPCAYLTPPSCSILSLITFLFIYMDTCKSTAHTHTLPHSLLPQVSPKITMCKFVTSLTYLLPQIRPKVNYTSSYITFDIGSNQDTITLQILQYSWTHSTLVSFDEPSYATSNNLQSKYMQTSYPYFLITFQLCI